MRYVYCQVLSSCIVISNPDAILEQKELSLTVGAVQESLSLGEVEVLRGAESSGGDLSSPNHSFLDNSLPPASPPFHPRDLLL